jgi:hypothetical protein
MLRGQLKPLGTDGEQRTFIHLVDQRSRQVALSVAAVHARAYEHVEQVWVLRVAAPILLAVVLWSTVPEAIEAFAGLLR